jgi:PKD repeat protein
VSRACRPDGLTGIGAAGRRSALIVRPPSGGRVGLTPAPLSGTAQVADAALTPTSATFNATAGDALNGEPVATFKDSYAGGQATDYTASIAWGDGATTAGFVEGSDGTYDVRGSHTYAAPGTYAVVVTLTDAGGSASVTSAAQVSPVPSYVVGTFAYMDMSNPNAPPPPAPAFSVMIAWGDNTSPTAGTVSGNGGSYTVSGTHTYAEEGTDTAAATVTGPGGVATYFANVIVAAATFLGADAAPPAAPTATLKEVDFMHSLFIYNDLDPSKRIAWKWTADRFTPAAGGAAAVDKNGPIGYVQSTVDNHPTVDNLVVDINVTNPDDYKNKTVQVIGIPSNTDVSLIQGTADLMAGTSVLRSTSAKVTFPKKVEALDGFSITWYVAPPDAPTFTGTTAPATIPAKWIEADTSTDTLYVTYKASILTDAPLFLMDVDIGTSAAAGATSDDDVVKGVMKKFKDLYIREAGDPTQGSSAKPGPLITYWNDWIASQKRNTTERLLLNHDGNCVGWTFFFLDTLRAQGIGGGEGKQVQSSVEDEGLFVAQWNAAATPNNTDGGTQAKYPYANSVEDLAGKKAPLPSDYTPHGLD